MSYHPDPQIDAEIRVDAAIGAQADIAAGLVPTACVLCGHAHQRGAFHGYYRCLYCGEVTGPKPAKVSTSTAPQAGEADHQP